MSRWRVTECSFIPGSRPQRHERWFKNGRAGDLIPAPPRIYDQPRIAPDGGHVAVHAAAAQAAFGQGPAAACSRGLRPARTDNYLVWTKDGQIFS